METIAIGEEKAGRSIAVLKRTGAGQRNRTFAGSAPGKFVCDFTDVSGKAVSCRELAAKMKAGLSGRQPYHLCDRRCFGYGCIGHRADERISFSKMTFTHQMIRLLLVEQIYRAFKISRGEKYHW
ncbi:MAG: 23S rRNA (pseudouridine(1915)-N(3))-methyltransferase RlmH [Phascolarctobacterium faecium]